MSRRVFRRLRFLTSLLAMVAVVAGVTQAVAFIEAPHAAKAAAAAATGTGGQFVPVQGRALDTRAAYQVGPYNTPMQAGVWRKVTLAGLTMSDGSTLPTSVSAVAVNFSVIAPALGGYLNADKDDDSPNASFAYMRWTSTDDQSNTATLPVAANGKIQVKSSVNVNLLIEIEGYYTADDTVAPGGYVPVTPKRIVDTSRGVGLPQASLKAGSTTTIQVSGSTSGVPAGASAAMVNITTFGDHSSKSHYYVPYPADEPKPAGYSMSFPIGDTDGSQVQVGLSTTTANGAPVGAFKLYFSQPENYTVDIQVDVVGYFASGISTGAFTPAAARVYATGSYDQQSPARATLASQETRTVQVAGINGVPQAGSGISAVALHLSVYAHGTNGGYTEVWANGKPRPSPYSSLNLDRHGYFIGNMVTTQLGDNGAVSVFNQSQDTVDILVDVEGWYSGVGSAITNGQTQTQQSLTLQADPSVGGSWVSYQYRDGSDGAFTDVPVSDVVPASDKSGPHPSWPIQKANSSFTAYSWNVANTLAALPANNGVAPDTLIQVQACYRTSGNDPNPVCNMPSNIQFSSADGGDATTDIGPGSLSELTGDLQLGATDANAATSLGSLSVGRSLSTLNPAPASSGAGGVFGPGWTADFPAASGGAADLSVTDNSAKHYLTFTGSDGSGTTYLDPQAATAYPMTFEASGDNVGDDTLVTKVDATTITMTEADGTITTWKRAGSPVVWRADSVATSAANSTTSYTYGASGNTNGLITRIQAPAPSGIDCSTNPDTTAGCRSLILTYGTTSATDPNNVCKVAVSSSNRLASVDLSIPQTSGAEKHTVACYSYDGNNRLAAAWDPRISPALKTAYTYTSTNQLATLTPPGLAAWSLAYDGTGRLKTASRPDPSGQTATSTVVYDVPTMTSNGGPVDLSASATASWGQTDDLPTTGTAVFGPDHTPAGITPAAVTASDWPYASIDYQDVNGRTVDTANYGAGAWQIGATGYDPNGNEAWTLTPGNRAQALTTTADTDSYVAGTSGSAARAALLTSTSVYGNPLNPSQLTDTYGPTHPIVLADGSTIHGRSHVVTTYDDGAPNGDVNPTTGQAYGLTTSVTTSAYRVDGTPGDTSGTNSQTTKTGYDPIQPGDKSGWDLRQATVSTVVIPGATNLVTKTRYDANGRVIEKRLPNDDGTGPRTTLSTYYTYASGSSGPCVDRTRVGLLCSTAPAGQPSSGAPLPVVSYIYDQYGKQTAKTQTYGSGGSQVVRTNTTSYDPGERTVTTAVAVAPTAAGGAALPVVTTSYAADTGLATVVSTTTGGTTTSLTTGYDSLGRKVKYTDATGNVSTTGYNLSGDVATANNGKHTTTYSTDSATEHRGLTTGKDIGVSTAPSGFTASYDVAGNMASETYPNGLVATRRYDNAGDLFSLTYTKGGSSWLAFTQDVNALGQISRQTSPQSSQIFGYDAANRLTSVQDTYQGSCTTRAYTFDEHSNRTSLTTTPAATGGACSASTTPATTNYNYDAADRLTSDTPGGSYSYDTLGRATQIPSADARGTGGHASITGNPALGYYANDMVNTQTQGGTTDSFTLDPNQNRINSQVDGSTTTVNHYSGDGDSPAWTGTANTWTEYATDPTGNLVANINQSGAVTLQLVNPHGDIVAAVADTASASAPASSNETTEYGSPRDAASAPSPYGWLGAKQRSNGDLAGLQVMGVRLYEPSIGRFTSVDPIQGGNDNAYTYPLDPVAKTDTTGMFQATCGNVTCTITPQYGTTRFVLQNGIFSPAITSAVGAKYGAWVGWGLTVIVTFYIGTMWKAWNSHKLVSFKFGIFPPWPFLYYRTYKTTKHHSWRL